MKNGIALYWDKEDKAKNKSAESWSSSDSTLSVKCLLDTYVGISDARPKSEVQTRHPGWRFKHG